MKRVRLRCAYSIGTPESVTPESCAPVRPCPRQAHRRARDHSPIQSKAHLFDECALDDVEVAA